MKTPQALLLALLLAACGGEARVPSEPPAATPPSDPESALAWVEEAQDDPATLRARLDAWPRAEPFLSADETQLAWTWRLQLALRDGDVEGASALQALLATHFSGRGRYPAGRPLGADAVRLGVFEEALLEARRRIEGARPDASRARSALDVAARMLLPEDEEDLNRLAGTRAWVEAGTAAEVLGAVGVDATTRSPVDATLVVFADDFALGESLFLEVLTQWGDAHRGSSFERLVVPLIRGQVRMGMRLVPAESEAAELASVRSRCAQAGLSCAAAVSVDRLAALGLETGDTALVLADGRGRIVARLCGRTLDPRALEPVLQRLLSR